MSDPAWYKEWATGAELTCFGGDAPCPASPGGNAFGKWAAAIDADPVPLSWSLGATDQLISDNPRLSAAVEAGLAAYVAAASAAWQATPLCPRCASSVDACAGQCC